MWKKKKKKKKQWDSSLTKKLLLAEQLKHGQKEADKEWAAALYFDKLNLIGSCSILKTKGENLNDDTKTREAEEAQNTKTQKYTKPTISCLYENRI